MQEAGTEAMVPVRVRRDRQVDSRRIGELVDRFEKGLELRMLAIARVAGSVCKTLTPANITTRLDDCA